MLRNTKPSRTEANDFPLLESFPDSSRSSALEFSLAVSSISISSTKMANFTSTWTVH